MPITSVLSSIKIHGPQEQPNISFGNYTSDICIICTHTPCWFYVSGKLCLLQAPATWYLFLQSAHREQPQCTRTSAHGPLIHHLSPYYLILGKFSMTIGWDMFFSDLGPCFCWQWWDGLGTVGDSQGKANGNHASPLMSCDPSSPDGASINLVPLWGHGLLGRHHRTYGQHPQGKFSCPCPSTGMCRPLKSSQAPGERGLLCGRRHWRFRGSATAKMSQSS